MRFRRLRPRLDWPRVAALCAVLLLAQATAISHLGLDEAHAADGACAFCIGASVLAAGNVPVAHFLNLSTESEPAIEFVGFAAGVLWQDHRYARGPPQAS